MSTFKIYGSLFVNKKISLNQTELACPPSVLLLLASNTNSSVFSLARRHTPEHELRPGLYILGNNTWTKHLQKA